MIGNSESNHLGAQGTFNPRWVNPNPNPAWVNAGLWGYPASNGAGRPGPNLESWTVRLYVLNGSQIGSNVARKVGP